MGLAPLTGPPRLSRSGSEKGAQVHSLSTPKAHRQSQYAAAGYPGCSYAGRTRQKALICGSTVSHD